MAEVDSSFHSGGTLGVTKLALLDGSQLVVPDRIVSDDMGNIRNPLTDDMVYSKLQRNKYFEVQPSVVYFGGFVLDHMHEQVVHLVNISSQTKRIHILQCETPFFRVCVDKKGRVAPGMSEQLRIQFTPNEWRYYYDMVRIHSEDDNLIIPLHAYPTVVPIPAPGPVPRNTIQSRAQAEFFPSKVDMGWCQLSKTIRKLVPISCDVPVDFEFSVRVLEPHPDMEVGPMQGFVPGEDTAYVTFAYTPSRMATATMTVEVSISQFGFKPQKCAVIGSAGPGAIREETMNTITTNLKSKGLVGQKFTLQNVCIALHVLV